MLKDSEVELHDKLPNLIAVAQAQIHNNQTRVKYFPDCALNETSWNIIIDLFVAAGQRQNISVSSACIASGSPATTALRHIYVLEKHLILERYAAQDDKRIQYLCLTEEARWRMADWLNGVALASQRAVLSPQIPKLQ